MRFFIFIETIVIVIITSLVITGCSKNNQVVATTSTTINHWDVLDIDGNGYDSVIIGTQTWLTANLMTTHYRNGSSIPNITDSAQWNNDSLGAFCNYNNDQANGATYGHLYNWHAVNNPSGLCPEGWHIPSDSEWNILINYLGGDSTAGGKMKDTGYASWNYPNIGATNSSGFAGLASGNRLINDYFYGLNNYAHFWSTTSIDDTTSWSRYLYYNGQEIYREYSSKQVGFSCRCIRD